MARPGRIQFENVVYQLSARGNGLLTRMAAYRHLLVNCGLKQTLVADYFKVSIHAVSKGIRRLVPEIFSQLPLKKLRGMSNVEV